MGAPCRVTFGDRVFFKPDFVKRFLDTLHLEDSVVEDSKYLKSIGYDNAFNEGDPLLIREKKEEAKAEAKAEVKKAEPSIDNVAQKAGISPKNIRDLYKINRELFSLNQVKALASAVAMDRMISVMAKRAGVTKVEMYGKLKFEKATEQDLPQGVKMQVDAWHGSPYEFDKFQTAFMGKGEGAQAFGWGLYFTDLKNIAKSYAKSLAKATFKGEALDESPFFEKLFIGLDADNESFYNYETGQITNLDEFKKYIDDMYESMLVESKEIDSNNKIVQRLLSDNEYADSKIKEAQKSLKEYRSLDTGALYDKLIKNGVSDKDAKSLIDSFNQSREGNKRFLYEASKYKASRENKLNQAIQFVKNQNKSDLNYFKFLKDNFDKFNLSRNLYKVTLHEGKSPEQYTWLEWDKPVSDEAKAKVKEELTKLGISTINDGYRSTSYINGEKVEEVIPPKDALEGEFTGKQLYEYIALSFSGSLNEIQKEASLLLLRAGVDGIKYPAESVSRGATSGTARGFNYVVFDENAVSIEEVIKFQKDAEKARGAMMITLDGQATIYALTDPNVSTPLHELAHVFEHYLTDGEKKAVMDAANTKEWNTKTSEYFARGFEKYLAEGKSPIAALDKIFAKFKEWLTDIYNGILGSDIDIKLNDEMRNIYAQMLGKEIVNKPASQKTSIFDDFDSTNKGKSIKSKAEANKAFKEKYGEDAAVAKAISSNFEAIADELKAKGIFTKIKC
jgi:hypothetical protein